MPFQCPTARTTGFVAGNVRSWHIDSTGALIMGKYLLGWILGVPVIVLVIIYMLFN